MLKKKQKKASEKPVFSMVSGIPGIGPWLGSMPSWWGNVLGSAYPWGSFPFSYPFPNSILIDHSQYAVLQHFLGNPRLWTFRHRASLFGADSPQFRSRCVNVGATITIIKSSGGYIFGGYNPHSWSSTQGYQSGAGSFLFLLTNPYGNPPTKFNWSTSHGPYDHSSYNPRWGGGHDLYLHPGGTNCSVNFSSYTNPLGNGNNVFTGSGTIVVSDFEVFSV